MVQAQVEEFTIDELAARTGMTVRTLRFYATEGLLPAPTRRGRVAYYDSRHRLRLDLVRTLQEHGYTLAAIERVLARIPFDADPAQYARPRRSAGAVAVRPDRACSIAPVWSAGSAVTSASEDLAYMAQTGAIEASGDGYRVLPAMLGHAIELLHAAGADGRVEDLGRTHRRARHSRRGRSRRTVRRVDLGPVPPRRTRPRAGRRDAHPDAPDGRPRPGRARSGAPRTAPPAAASTRAEPRSPTGHGRCVQSLVDVGLGRADHTDRRQGLGDRVRYRCQRRLAVRPGNDDLDVDRAVDGRPHRLLRSAGRAAS